MTGKFSPFVIKALVDTITGGAGNDNAPAIGIYRSGPKIEQFFLDCGLDMRIGASSRVPATTDFLRQTANHYDGNGDIYVTRIIERVCDPRDYLAEPDKAIAVREHLNKALAPDGLAVVIVGGKALVTERRGSGTIVEPFIQKVATLDFDTVQMEIARALPNLEDDPEDAVTAACSLIEAVCRSILVELKLPLPPKKDIDGLMRAVQEPLGLSPGRSDLPSEVESDIRQTLSGLTSVAKGIGALRTHGGDAHGRERGFRRIDARIARLALNAASSLALFLIESWERKEHRSLPQHAGET
ncbi:abortive infection family protein [Sphingobium sp. AP49]|uniref:abortive infection family protein n=1 Tax=Sphingobium sp. AP49 TaxID=1144307 RepID=UPI00026ECA8F|nr:abortive infection family protein [Sphingobium sp. AP49]WHO37805.1 abortive infection family protein [Sphingobium sp. AP49]